MIPTVYLIGAGPGDPGLLTLRGKELLERCDVLVYDYLANNGFLDYVRPGTEIIYAGKKGGNHALSQAEINSLIIAKAREGKVVVRLKGGDPYMFGRGAEEAEELVAAGIGFEIVPGVTSAVAAPAYAGIPLTHRGFASSVCFVTGHEDISKTESAHDWKALASGTSTLVFFMGMKNLPDIAAKLQENGMDPATPAALVQWGTTPDHRSIVGTLAELPDLAKANKFSSPALIVIGSVVSLHDTLNWFEKKPLLGKGVLVTRSRDQASSMVRQLMGLGARVVEYPTIRTIALEENSAIREAILRLKTYDWIVFTSQNGVRYFWDQIEALGLDARMLAGCRIAVMGMPTAEVLAVHGLKADLLPKRYIAEELLAAMVAEGVEGTRILIPRAEQARNILPEGLERAGAECDIIPVYKTVPETAGGESVIRLLEKGEIQYITFASSSTVAQFLAAIPRETLERHPGLRYACIGPITAKTLTEAGFTCHIMPDEYTIAALVDAIASDAAK